MTKTTKSKWRALIAAQEKSGLTAREFAERRGITAATLYWWRSRLRRDTADLVPVEVVEHVEVGQEHHGAAFELRVGDLITLQIRAGFDESELRRLLRALQC
ncbi:MAG: hypothetical protein U1E73_09885 [Planctomycetota bacterium]